MTWVDRALAVEAAKRTLADLLCSTLAPGGSGANMWTIRLSNIGPQGQVTHYGANGKIQDQFAALLNNAAMTHALAVQAGLTCTLAEVQDLLSSSVISEQSWEQAYAEAGLYRVEDEA